MIYFIQTDTTKAVKIGYTRSRRTLKTRLQALQTATPETLTVLKLIRGTKHDEAEIHHRFRRSHIRGEWYKASRALLKYIKTSKPYGSRG